MKISTVRDNFILVTPATVLVVGLLLVPLFMNVVLSLYNWTAFRSGLEFSGFDNYRQLDQQNLLVPTVIRTLVYTFIAATLMVVGSLSLALSLERNTRSNQILRTVFFAPLILSPLAVGFVFRALLGLDGAVNGIISTILLRPIEIPWLGSTELSLFVVSTAVAWRWAPVLFIVFVAGLAAVPTDLIDAAKSDGAGTWSLIRYIKIPLIAPAITFNVVIALITALNVFETVFVLTGGGPGRSTQVLNFLVIIEFAKGRWGVAAALSTFLYAAIFIATVPLVANLRRREVQV